MSLPDLSHQSAPEARGEEHRDAEDGGPFYGCIHCGGQWITVRVPDSPCPARVLAWGDERETEGREAGRRALEKVAAKCNDNAHRQHALAVAVEFDGDGAQARCHMASQATWLHARNRINEALATLTDPEQT